MAKRDDARFDLLLKALDQLLGPVEEWIPADIDAVLAEAGTDADDVLRRLYDRANELAGAYRMHNEDVPSHLAGFMEQTRPPDMPTSDPQLAARNAQRWIDRVLKPKPSIGPLELSYEYRNKRDDLEPKDKAFLDELAATLKSEAEKRRS